MKVKELIERLEFFDEDDEVYIEQEYNSNGGYHRTDGVTVIDGNPMIEIKWS